MKIDSLILNRKVIAVLAAVLISFTSIQATDIYFSTLSMREGLPSNIISGITQDKYDFIWIATEGGLARFDGYNIKVFKKTESINSLPSNELNSVIASNNFVWVGSWQGLSKVNIETFEITRIDLGNSNAIRTLYKGDNDILWIGTTNGLIRYSLLTDTFDLFDVENNGLSHNMIRSIYEDHLGNVWVGTYDHLNKLVKGSQQFEIINLNSALAPTLKNDLILDIKPHKSQSDSLVWIGTETGLKLLNIYTNNSIYYTKTNAGFSNEVIKCIYTDDENNLWLGTDFGLNVFDIDQNSNDVYFHNTQQPYSIANNVIWQIFEDKGGVVWFVTSNGLSRANKYSNFYTYNEISFEIDHQTIGNQVKSFLTTKSGIYWLATQNGAIRMDPVTNTKSIFSTDSDNGRSILLNNVYALEEDQYGRIWIGTAGGINIWDENNSKMHAITASSQNGLTSNYIGKFTKQPDGTLWVSAWQGGLFKLNGNILHTDEITFESVPTMERGSELHVYGDGYIWSVVYDKLYRIDPNTLESNLVKSFEETARNKNIYSIYFSKNGHLWASTLNGLIQYVPMSDRTVFHPIERGDDVITTSIIEDELGNIWSTTNTTLQKLYINDYHIEVFPLDKNLPIKSFYYGCSSKTTNGELVFGGDNGFISFLPGNVLSNDYKPDVYITSLEVNNNNVAINEQVNGRILLNRDISFVKNLEIDYQQRSVTFEFSSLHFWQPEMNFYAYKLEGFDDEWKFVTGLKNFAIYSNLKSGNYTFRVKGSNNYGIVNDTETLLNLTVKPPLFLSPMFIIIYVIIVFSMIFYALRAYSGRVHLKNQLKITRLEKEHSEEIEKTKERFFTNISHELRTPISLILPVIHEIQKKGKLDTESSDLISLAEKNSARLLRLVNQILDFNKIENDTLQIKVSSIEMVSFCEEVFYLFTDRAARSEINFVFETPIKNQYVWVDTEKIETVLFNLLSNAFKFTPKKGSIVLKVSIENDNSEFKEGTFIIQVTDSGVGINKEDQSKIFERFYQAEDGKNKNSSSGIGLTLAAEYVDLHHGLIAVDSAIGAGTTFIVNLPLGKSHFPIDSFEINENISLLAKRSVHGYAQGTKKFQLDLESDKPLLLLIEDNNDMVEFIRSSLSHKFNFVTAENGKEGLLKANNFIPQLIISDIMMPVMDGLTLCKKIKENPKTSHISIVLLTAKSLNSNKVEGIKIGADAYITKPFEIDLLEAHIDQLIERKKELTAYFRNDLIRMPSGTDASNNEDNKFVKRVMDIIEANIWNSELTVEMISDEMAMSSTHLYRKLKATTDHSAKEIIQKYRLKKASLLLKNKEGNITEIMYQVGFSSLSYFSKCFKAEYEISPKRYQSLG